MEVTPYMYMNLVQSYVLLGMMCGLATIIFIAQFKPTDEHPYPIAASVPISFILPIILYIMELKGLFPDNFPHPLFPLDFPLAISLLIMWPAFQVYTQENVSLYPVTVSIGLATSFFIVVAHKGGVIQCVVGYSLWFVFVFWMIHGAVKSPYMRAFLLIRRYKDEFLEPGKLPVPPGPIGEAYRTLYSQESRPSALPALPKFSDPDGSINLWFEAAQKIFARNSKEIADFYVEQATRVNKLLSSIVPNHAEGPFRVPLIDAIPNLNLFLSNMLTPFFSPKATELGVATAFRETYLANQQAVSMRELSASELKAGTMLRIRDFRGTPSEVVNGYLKGTVFENVFKGEVPLGYKKQSTRFEHTWIVAPPNSGKTTLLQAMIANDLAAVERGEASVIVLDSQPQMIDRLKELKLFERVPLHVIDPAEDISVNPFTVEGLGTERADTTVVELLRYVIGSLLDAPMTPKQTSMFRRVIRGLLQSRDPTLKTMMHLLQGKLKLDPSRLDPDTRSYFEDSFYKDASLRETKDQVAWRIDGILGQSTTVERILSQPTSDINFERALTTPSVTLVYTNDDLMGKEGCAFLGRLCIAQILRAARARSGTGHDMPVYVYVDEAHDVISTDPNVAILLAQVRKYNVGFTFAHQWISQIKSPEVVDALSNAGSIFASRNRDDAKRLAGYMNCAPELITSRRAGEFVIFIRDQTDQGIPVKVPGDVLSRMPKSSARYRPRTVTPEEASRYETATPAEPLAEPVPPKKSDDDIDITPSISL